MIGRIDRKSISLAKHHLGIDLSSVGSAKGIRRTIIKCPKFPGAHQNGYALRSRVVWWLNTGEVIKGTKIDIIHHRNHDRLDDRFINLQRLQHREHSQLHNHKTCLIQFTCEHCRKPFEVERWRLSKSAGRAGRFCSQICYHKTQRKPEHAFAISEGLKRAYTEGRR